MLVGAGLVGAVLVGAGLVGIGSVDVGSVVDSAGVGPQQSTPKGRLGRCRRRWLGSRRGRVRPTGEATTTPAARIAAAAAPAEHMEALRCPIPLSGSTRIPLPTSARVAQPTSLNIGPSCSAGAATRPHPGEQIDRCRNRVVDEFLQFGDAHRLHMVVDTDPTRLGSLESWNITSAAG